MVLVIPPYFIQSLCLATDVGSLRNNIIIRNHDRRGLNKIITIFILVSTFEQSLLKLNSMNNQQSKTRTGQVDALLAKFKKQKVQVLSLNLENLQPGKKLGNKTITGGNILEKPAPVYTLMARQKKATGNVKVKVIINEDGEVIAAQPVKGNPLLLPAATRAAKNTRFKPTKLSGQPIKVTGTIFVTFVS